MLSAIWMSLAWAQPGTETDPVISLSYLDTAMSMSPVVLEGGEEFRVSSGRTIVLLDGTARLSPPSEGRTWIVDTTSGEVHETGIDLTVGHLYIPVADDSETAVFTVMAWQSSTIAVPGGTGR